MFHEETSGRRPSVVRIGLIVPLSGGSSYLGKVIANGITLALAKDAVLHENDVRVEALPARDDASDPKRSAELLKELHDEGVAAVLGPVDSHCAGEAALVCRRLRIPLVTPAATASGLIRVDPDSGKVENGWFFRAISSDNQRARELAEWVGYKYPSGIVLLHEVTTAAGDPVPDVPLYGHGMALDLRRRLEAIPRPSTLVGYPQNIVRHDLRAFLLKELAPRNPVAMAVLGRSQDTIELAKAIRKIWHKMPIYLISPGKEAYATIDSRWPIYAVTDTVIQNVNLRRLRDFRAEYLGHYPSAAKDEAVDRYATFGFDAANIVIGAIRRAIDSNAVSKNASGAIDELRKRVRDELEETPTDRVGVISNGSFVNHELRTDPHLQKLVKGVWQDINEDDLFRVETRPGPRPDAGLSKVWTVVDEWMDQHIRRVEDSWVRKAFALLVLVSSMAGLLAVIANWLFFLSGGGAGHASPARPHVESAARAPSGARGGEAPNRK